MYNKLFEKAKQAIAKKNGFENWQTMFSGYYALCEEVHNANTEAAELYAQWMCNEAVMGDSSKTPRMQVKYDGWVIIRPDDSIIEWSFAATRHLCILKVSTDTKNAWRKWKKDGFRCEKATNIISVS